MTNPTELVTVTVRADDLDDAIGCVGLTHGDRCVSTDDCGCTAEAQRLQDALDGARPARDVDGGAMTRTLRVLDVLAAAGIEGDDAITALDTLLTRLGAELCRTGDRLPAVARVEHITNRFGSDAARVAWVLVIEARVRAALVEVGVDEADLPGAVAGTLALMRSAGIGVDEAIDTTIEARVRFDLQGDDQ